MDSVGPDRFYYGLIERNFVLRGGMFRNVIFPSIAICIFSFNICTYVEHVDLISLKKKKKKKKRGNEIALIDLTDFHNFSVFTRFLFHDNFLAFAFTSKRIAKVSLHVTCSYEFGESSMIHSVRRLVRNCLFCRAKISLQHRDVVNYHS